ncbi:7329_t:CDS:2, partial [Scutellospora calospora]
VLPPSLPGKDPLPQRVVVKAGNTKNTMLLLVNANVHKDTKEQSLSAGE